MAAIVKFLEPLEVHHNDDAYASQGAHRWGNRDIYPIVKKERTYSTWAYFAYWATAGICITSWTLGSSMIGIGLTAGQACGAVLAGSTFASILGFLAGQAGRTLFLRYGLLFTPFLQANSLPDSSRTQAVTLCICCEDVFADIMCFLCSPSTASR
jgi:NCS1 family nucleobase:cation symporter-1